LPPSDVSHTHGELDVTVIDDPHDAEAIRGQWDQLAVAAGRPYCSPAWMLSWWARARTGDARLRTIVIRDRSSVLAIAPFFAQVGRLGLTEYRLLAAGISHRIGVLWREGHELALAEPLGDALSRLHPRPSSIVWEGIDARDESPARSAPALSGPAGVKLRRDAALDAPTIHLAGRSFEEWLDATSNNFRKGILKDRRNLAKSRGTIRRTRSGDELEADLATLARLHHARWADRGGSGFFDARMVSMLRDVAGYLLATDRFRLYVVELEGTPIGVTVCVAAGGTVAPWGIGMDNAHARLSPTRLALVSAVEEACERGERWFDLGGGAEPYKLRFADHNEPVVWMTQFPRGVRYPLARAQLLPKHVRYRLRDLARRLPAERQQQLKRIVRRR
jgi:CelD/BcsL family acetyltransferase involved in cellulose biosynthesis